MSFESEKTIFDEILKTIKPQKGLIVVYDLEAYKSREIKKFEFNNHDEHFNFFSKNYYYNHKEFFSFYNLDEKAYFIYFSNSFEVHFDLDKNEIVEIFDGNFNTKKIGFEKEIEQFKFDLAHPPKILPIC